MNQRATPVLLGLLLLLPTIHAFDTHINTTVREGETVTARFINSTGENHTILRDGSIVSTNKSYQWETGRQDSGTYTFTFRTNESSKNRTVQVLDVPFRAFIERPETDTVGSKEIAIRASTNWRADSCQYSLDSTSDDLTRDDEHWTTTVLLEDGVYQLNVSCQLDNATANAGTVFMLDTSPPTIDMRSPNGSFRGTPIRVEVATDEIATCRYGTTNGAYGTLENEFSQTGGTNHTQLLDRDTQGNYTLYVACKDQWGNTGTPKPVTFHANLRPTARIAIEDGDGRLNAGTYEVRLTTSEPVLEPTLEYSFSNDGDIKDVSLSGSGTDWQGYISIPEDVNSDVGSFSFTATDRTDLKGTVITSGKMFLVDTEPPPPVESASVEKANLSAKLTWYYSGETVDHFTIYRSNEPGVGKTDTYTETVETTFVDRNVLPNATYHYKIAPVDQGGNVGPLSDELSISFAPQEGSPSRDAQRKLNETREILKQNVFTIEQAIEQLRSYDNQRRVTLVSRLDLIEEAKQAKNDMQRLIQEIAKLRLAELDKGTVQERIESILDRSETFMRSVPKEVEITGSVRHDHVPMSGQVKHAVEHITVGFNMSDAELQGYTENMRQLQDRASVRLDAFTGRITYHDTVKTNKRTLIHKAITTDSVVNDSVVVENVPKSVARTVDDIRFSEEPVVLEEDPVVKWEEASLDAKDVWYSVDAVTSLADVKQSSTVILTKPERNETNAVTGQVATQTGGSGGSAKAATVVGLVLLLTLTGYYAYLRNRETTHRIVSQHVFPTDETGQEKERIDQTHRKNRTGFYNLIRSTHDRLDATDFEAARELYDQLVEKMDVYMRAEDANEEFKETLSREAEKLYTKFQLIEHIGAAHEAKDRSDRDELVDRLQEIKELYHRLGSESDLAAYTREHYSHLTDHTKELEKQEFFEEMD